MHVYRHITRVVRRVGQPIYVATVLPVEAPKPPSRIVEQQSAKFAIGSVDGPKRGPQPTSGPDADDQVAPVDDRTGSCNNSSCARVTFLANCWLVGECWSVDEIRPCGLEEFSGHTPSNTSRFAFLFLVPPDGNVYHHPSQFDGSHKFSFFQ